MAKRFTDTDKWKKPFIRGMKAPYKLLWLYILDECNHAGVWQVDLEVAEIKIGEKLNLEKDLEFFNGKIHPFNNDEKWFIYDFIDFQYGTLNPENRAHNSVIKILNKYDIDYKNKPLISPLQGAKDKDKDKELDKDKDKAEKLELIFPYTSEKFLNIWNVLVKEKKWRNKSKNALQASLKKLSLVSELDAIQMIENCIAGEWQGLVELKNQNNGITKNGNGNRADLEKLHHDLKNRHSTPSNS